MISRLPSWTWPVAWLLAFVAGGANAVGLLGATHQAVSHLTGTTTLLAAALVDGSASTALLFLAAAAFVGGAAVGGFLIPTDVLRLGRRQTVVMLLVAGLLVLATVAFEQAQPSAIALAAAACGLQNAMTTAYSGAVVRTSHVSGMFTDLGIALGHVARGAPVERRRLLLCATVITGFFAGGLVAALLFREFGARALYASAALAFAMALANAFAPRLPRAG
ncbi:YoaK family protein [Lysobacter xanthus]